MYSRRIREPCRTVRPYQGYHRHVQSPIRSVYARRYGNVRIGIVRNSPNGASQISREVQGASLRIRYRAPFPSSRAHHHGSRKPAVGSRHRTVRKRRAPRIRVSSYRNVSLPRYGLLYRLRVSRKYRSNDEKPYRESDGVTRPSEIPVRYQLFDFSYVHTKTVKL